MQAVEVRLPQWGMGMQEGEVLQWYRFEGEAVQEGEPLVEIDAAKITEEIAAPATGVLSKIVVREGETIAVRALLAVITTDGPGEGAQTESSTGGGAEMVGDVSHVRPSPRARRVAHELGVDPASLHGTGPGGSVTERDVREASTLSAYAVPFSAVPLTPTRRAIGQRLRESVQSMVQVTLLTDVDVSGLVSAYEQRTPGSAVTYTAYLVRAASLALAEHPWLNASVEAEQLRLFSQVNVGVAVSTDSGLRVPVIHDADRKSVEVIADEVAELSRQARAGTLTRRDVTGGTFTVTNLGMFGIDAFTPIINPPEAATLGVGRIVDKPHPTPDGGVQWRKAMTLSLTFDHRIVDGTGAAAFLAAVGAWLSRWPASDGG